MLLRIGRLAALLAALALAPVSALAGGYQMGYHPVGQYFGPPDAGMYRGVPPHPYVAGAWTPSNYQPYHPSYHTQYSTGAFRGTTLGGPMNTSGVYRVSY